MLVDFVAVTDFVQHRHCHVLLWRQRSYELVFCGGLYQIVSFSIRFLLCFLSFLFIGVWFRVFPWRWRWVVTLFRLCDLVWKSWIWFYGFKIWVL